jgi:hypothetical protein
VPHKTVINDVGASWNDTRETLFLFTFLGAAEATCGDISRGKKSRVVETRPGRKIELGNMLGILDSLKPPPPFYILTSLPGNMTLVIKSSTTW